MDLAKTGQEVLNWMEKKDYDIILMDMEMPIMDGFTATVKIREQKKYENQTIIALTAHAMKEHRDKTIKAGCTDYLSKPVNREKLEKMLAKYMKLITRAEEEALEEQKQGEVFTQADSGSAEGDSEEDSMMAELARFFISDLGQRLEQLDDDMSTRNLEEVTRFGHSLKGTGGSYGFPTFTEIGGKIESAGLEGDWTTIEIYHQKLIEEYKRVAAENET